MTYKFYSSPKRLKEGGSNVLVRASRSGKGGSDVWEVLLEDDSTVLALLLDYFYFLVSSFSESVMSSMMGSTILPERKWMSLHCIGETG